MRRAIASRRWARFPLSCAIGLAGAIVFLSGCTANQSDAGSSQPPSTIISDAERTEILASLIAHLSCGDSDFIADEISFYDAVTGRDCYSEGGEVTFVRVYETSTSVAQTLVDWEPTLGSDRDAIWGPHWYVVGPPGELQQLRNAQHIGATRVLPSPAPLTPRQEQLTTCGRFLESATRAYIFARTDYVGDTREFQELFPGAREMIESTLIPKVISELATRGEDRAMASIVDRLPHLKRICEKAPPESASTP